MAYVAQRLGGGVWTVVIVATVLVSTSTSLWTTMLYLSRSVFAMGRDGIFPTTLARIDRRGVPAVSLVAVTIGVIAFTLLTGVLPSVAAALTFVLSGSSIFLGALFGLSGAAAAFTFRRDGGRDRLTGIAIPALGSVLLLAIIAIQIVQGGAATWLFAAGGLVLGIPFAWWRGRAVVAHHPDYLAALARQ
jgi:amino acid transporter